MARAITNVIRVAMIEEVTPGTTPATPALIERRATRENFMPKALFTRSEQFNTARALEDQILVARRTEGGFGFEWRDGENEDLWENALWGAWSTDVLVSGNTRKSHSAEVKFEAGASDQYKLLTGLQVSEAELNLVAGEKVQGNFNFIGMGSSFPVTQVTGATYVAAGNEPVSVTGDMALSSTGLTVDAVTRLSFKINNNLRVQQCLGSFNPSGIGAGTFDLSGDIEMYLNTGTVDHVTNFLANTSFTLLATIGNTTLKKTRLEVPKAKFSDLTIVGEGNDQDVMVRGQWVGVYDSGIGGTMRMTRNIA